jgi:hypothetical protein
MVVGRLPGGGPIFAPEWLDTAALLGVRAYRAKSTGKVERLNREVK